MLAFLSALIAHPNFFRWFIVIGTFFLASYSFIHSLEGIFFPFLAGGIGAYLFNKPLLRLVDKGVPRSLGAAFLILTFIILLIFITSVALPYLQNELISFAKDLPAFAQKIYNHIRPFLKDGTSDQALSLHTFESQISTYLGDVMKWSVQILINLLTNGILLANVLSLVILTPIVMFYFLRDWTLITHTLQACLPSQSEPRITHLFKKIDLTLSSYIKGQMTVCAILVILYGISLFIIGLHQAWVLGLIAGILSFIPYLGMVIGLIASISVTLAHFTSWTQFILVLIVFTCVGLIEGNVLTPRFVGQRIGLHPVLILFSLLAFGTWFGFAGIVIALPTSAVIAVIIRDFTESNQPYGTKA